MGHDAERAALVAALHHGHERRRSLLAGLGACGQEARLVEIEHGAHRRGRATGGFLGELGEFGDVVGTDDEIDRRHALQQPLAFLLRDAAGDADDESRAPRFDEREPPDLAPELLLGLLAHAAGVQEHEIRALEIGLLDPARRAQHLPDSLRIVLVHLAPEGDDGKAGHAPRPNCHAGRSFATLVSGRPRSMLARMAKGAPRSFKNLVDLYEQSLS